LQLVSAVRLAIHAGMYGALDEQTLMSTLPSTVDDRLKRLVVSIIIAHGADWRDRSLESVPSLPRLVDFDWRADIKTGSNLQSRMAVPTAIVELKVFIFLCFSSDGK